MEQAKQMSDLEVEEEPDFQRREWRVQRIGWVLMGLVVLAALLGLLGGAGPVSQASIAANSGDLRLDYLRFIHLLEPNQLRLFVQPQSDQAELQITINGNYLNHFTIESISPEPESVQAAEDTVIYVFKIAGGGEVEIVYHLNPNNAGTVQGQISLVGGESLDFNQIIYP